MRSVVLKPTARCQHCQLPPRWCVCAAQDDIRCALQIDLLTHRRERQRPSSTGNLIKRVFPAARQFIWAADAVPAMDVLGGRERWILHPHGKPAPAGADPAAIQVLLLDGSWSETMAMARTAPAWGRLVSLPMQGQSRFWLRAQQEGGRFSTAEALMFLLGSLGLEEERERLRVQFELLVYANLRARGRNDIAAEFLEGSLIGDRVPDFLDALQAPRPLLPLARDSSLPKPTSNDDR